MEPGHNVRVYLVCGITDMRKGIDGLSTLVINGLGHKLGCNSVFVFRGRRGNRLKVLYWDGQGFCLYYQVLDKGHFPWVGEGHKPASICLTRAQLAMLWEGMDWRRPEWSAPPERVG